MLALMRAWGGALFVLIVGIMIMVRLSPRVAPGTSIPLSDQVFRIHVPWLVISAAMVAVAGALHRRPPRLLATLPVPALAVVAGTAAGASGATSAVTALLYLGEGVLGAAAGLLIIAMFARRGETTAYPYTS